MKNFFLTFMCVAALGLCSGCGDDDDETTGSGESTSQVTTQTWASLVKEHSFLAVFPEFDGEVDNVTYTSFSGLETVALIDYKCESSVGSNYYEKLVAAGFTKSESSDIYTKSTDTALLTVSGTYSGGNLALSFGVSSK